MLRLTRRGLKGQTTEELKERRLILHQKIIYKQKILDKYRHLIVQICGNCSESIREFELIDRMIFFREGRVKVIKNEYKKDKIITKKIEEMSDKESAVLLERLLAVRDARQNKLE